MHLQVLLDEARKKEEIVTAGLDKYKESKSTKDRDIADLRAQLTESHKQHTELKAEAAGLKQANLRMQDDLQQAKVAIKEAEDTAGAERANRLQQMMQYGNMLGENQSLKTRVDVV